MQSDGAGQDLALQVAALADHVGHSVAVRHAHHVLLDDRSLVEVGGGVVGRRPDQLDAAGLRLVVGSGAGEGGQEGVVNVDDAPRPAAHEVRRQDLHVAGQHHQMDTVALEQFLLPRFGLRLAVGSDRHDLEGQAEVLGRGTVVGVIGNHQHHLAGQLAQPLPQQEIIQAVGVLAAEDRHAVAPVVEVQLRVQSQGAGEDFQAQADAFGVEGEAVQRPDEAHEEALCLGLAVLVEVQDVAAVAEDEVGQGGDDARAIGAANAQDGVGHETDLRPGAVSAMVSRLRPVIKKEYSPADREDAMNPHDLRPPRNRGSHLGMMLTVLALGFFVLVLIFISGGFFLYVVQITAGIFVVSLFHWAVWGRALSQAVAGEREEEQLRRRAAEE